MSTHSTRVDLEVEPTTSTNSTAALSPQPESDVYSAGFFDASNAESRKIYLQTVFRGLFMVTVVIFTIFPIFWGALWKTPLRDLDGWVVDFDGGEVGRAVVQALTSPEVGKMGKVVWSAIPASRFPKGLADVEDAIVQQHAWAAITINPGSTARLNASYISPNATYDGSEALTAYAVEARSENAYRILTIPSVRVALDSVCQSFAFQAGARLQAASNLPALLSASPQTIVAPIWYIINNLRPFNKPVASAVTGVGLIFQLILSFFTVMICGSARESSGLNRNLRLRSLVLTRYASSFAAYFILALFFSLVSVAFQLPFSLKFGRGGFMVYWMLNWAGMSAVGLALESLYTVLTIRFTPFFLLPWIIVNASVNQNPIEIMPTIYRYGYAAPFYNLSHGVRAIVFGSKNQLGQNFGVLFVWIGISCITLPFFQWFVRRRPEVPDEGAQPSPGPPMKVNEKKSG